ncbi:MAG TPA: hypothetical protein VK043_14545 [Burkholderiales bacterium]|nr:hypothetical protein [Burkholderiales bacterium]
MNRLIPALLLAGLAGIATAAPKAESAQECGIAADMAIVARSLAEEDIQQPKADAIMARIYDVGASQRGQTLMREILGAAYQANQTRTSQAFAEELFAVCIKSGGNMDPILGKRL